MEHQYQVCWVCFPQRDGVEPLHGEFVQARRKFFQNPRHAVTVEKSKDIKGYDGRISGKLSSRNLYWKKKVKGVSGGVAILEEAFRQRDGWVLVTRDLYGVIVSRNYFGKNHQWNRTEYYEPWDSGAAKVVFRPAPDGCIQRSDWDPDKKDYQTVTLSPAPYHFGTAEQSLVDAQIGQPQLVVATTEGELCFCSKSEAQARTRSMDDITSGTVVLMPAWEVKEGELIRDNNQEEANITFTSLEEYAKIEPPKQKASKPAEPAPAPAPKAKPAPASRPESAVARKPMPPKPEKPTESMLIEEERSLLPAKPVTPVAAESPAPFPAVPLAYPTPTEILIDALQGQTAGQLLFPKPKGSPPMRHAAPGSESPAPAAAPQLDPRFFADLKKPVMRHGAPEPAKPIAPPVKPLTPPVPQPVAPAPKPASAREEAVPQPVSVPAAQKTAFQPAITPMPMAQESASLPTFTPMPAAQVAAPKQASVIEETLPKPVVPKSTSEPKSENTTFSPVVFSEDRDGSLETILVEAALAAESDPSQPPTLPREAVSPSSVLPGYQGEIQDGMANGRGRLQQSNGLTSYEGEYQHGKRHGFGAYYYKDGNLCYAGSWKDDHRDGLGVSFRDSDHALHIANWKDGQPQGVVSLFDRDGNLRFSGRMADGKKEGAGVVINRQDGTVFVGQWSQGEATGLGSAFDKDGRLLYYGNWKDGKRHGHGTEFDCNGGVVFDGEFRDGRYYNGILYQKTPGMVPKDPFY